MANIFVPSVAPQLAAISAQTTDIQTRVINTQAACYSLRDTDLPIVEALLVDIHDNELPAVITAIANKSLRGVFHWANYNGVPGDTVYHEIVNESTPGKLFVVMGEPTASGADIRITIDGEVSRDVRLAVGQTWYMGVKQDATETQFDIERFDPYTRMEIEFTTSMIVEMKQLTGTNAMAGIVMYQLDT